MRLGLRLLVAFIALVAAFSVPAYLALDFGAFLWQSYQYLSIFLGALADIIFVSFLYLSRDIKGRGKTSGLSGAFLILMGLLYISDPSFSVTVLAYVFSTILFVIAIGYDIAKKRLQAWVSIIPLITIIVSAGYQVVPAFYLIIGVAIFAATLFYEMILTKKTGSSGKAGQTVKPVTSVVGQTAKVAAYTSKVQQPVTPSMQTVSAATTVKVEQAVKPAEKKGTNEFGYEPLKIPPSTDHAASFRVIKSWPSQGDYQRAFQNLKFAISDKYPDIRTGKIMSNPNVKVPGNIVYSSGNYGTIFKMELTGKPYAIKCFTKSSQDIQRRYYEISRYLKAVQDKYKIDALKNFQYLNQVVRTLKDPKFYYPVLKMDWIGGSVLNSFIADNVKKQSVLKTIAQSFLETSAKLHRLGVSHGDLAGDNIIITPDNRVALIDYDGMYVPAFRGEKAPEKGHEHFQHPDRSINHFSEDLDNFSSLIIYTSLMAVSSRPNIWNKYNKGDYDCLVFRMHDFKDPGSSPIINELSRESGIMGKLTNLIYKAIDHEPLWEQIAPERLMKI